MDPAADVPAGYRADQRDAPGGFAADPDVMDTWATSSLTPQIAAGWSTDDDLISRVFPMDLRPQAHEIIRTWLFYTVLRAQEQDGVLPWRHAAISGWIVDPDRKKMSKSTGNVLTPEDMLRQYGSDAVRYWAASARLGVDTVFDPAQLKIGRRLAVKILNASRFVLGFSEAAGADAGTGRVPGPVPIPGRGGYRADRPGAAAPAGDGGGPVHRVVRVLRPRRGAGAGRAVLLVLLRRLPGAGQAARLRRARVPPAAASAVTALRSALSAVLRLLAPFLPFVTEEVWSWWQTARCTVAPWPDPATLLSLADGPGAGPGAGGPDAGHGAGGPDCGRRCEADRSRAGPMRGPVWADRSRAGWQPPPRTGRFPEPRCWTPRRRP